MRKEKILALMKAKGFYAVLLVCFVAVALMAGVYVISTNDKNKSQDLVNLNEPLEDTSISEEETVLDYNEFVKDDYLIQSTEDEIAKVGEEIKETVTEAAEETYNRYDEYVEIFEDDTSLSQDELKEEVANNDNEEAEIKNEEVKEVIAPSTSVNTSLNFKEKDGLSWPVQGNVILNYSMDKTIYFQTLDQYKCNPAVLISASIGDKVTAAGKGIVESIETYSETGLTLVISMGNEYKAVYGQLGDVKLKVGDLIEEGETIGTVSEPSGYYELEGPSLYFKVMKKDNTVNPVSLFK